MNLLLFIFIVGIGFLVVKDMKYVIIKFGK